MSEALCSWLDRIVTSKINLSQYLNQLFLPLCYPEAALDGLRLPLTVSCARVTAAQRQANKVVGAVTCSLLTKLLFRYVISG